MRTSRIEQRQYIENLARQVRGRAKITEDDCREMLPFLFATVIYDRVYDWVSKKVTSAATLGRIIECAVGCEENAGTSLENVYNDSETFQRVECKNGLEILRELAVRTICAAMFDLFRQETRELEELQGSTDDWPDIPEPRGY